MTKIFILAAGEGSRMQPYTTLVPKAMMPVAGKPCIRRIVDRLHGQKLDDIYIIANSDYMSLFKHEFRDEDVKIIESISPQGTAGEMLNWRVREEIGEEPFVIYYGDELTDVNVKRLITHHLGVVQESLIGTLALISNVPLDFGVVEVEEDEITEFKEKPPFEALMWAGIAILEPEIYDFIFLGSDFALDVFPSALIAGGKLKAYYSDAEWLDIGSITHLRRASEKFEEVSK